QPSMQTSRTVTVTPKQSAHSGMAPVAQVPPHRIIVTAETPASARQPLRHLPKPVPSSTAQLQALQIAFTAFGLSARLRFEGRYASVFVGRVRPFRSALRLFGEARTVFLRVPASVVVARVRMIAARA